MKKLQVEIRRIQVEEYQRLRKTTGWASIEDDTVKTALKNDLFSVCVLDMGKVVGIGRVIGDGAIYFYIQDVIVHPAYQGKCIGAMIMDHIESYLKEAANNNSFIGLMAAEGVKAFYKKYGYKERQEGSPGMYKQLHKKTAENE